MATDIDFTRQQLALWLNQIIEQHRPCFGVGAASLQIHPGGASFDPLAAGMEGFCRLLWGVAAGLSGQEDVAHLNLFREGLSNGVDPEHPAYWQPARDGDQRVVEMAAIATLIHEAPQFIASLSPQARDNLCRWLTVVQGLELSANNWRFFRVLVLKALQQLQQPIDNALLAAELDFIDQQYVGEGWYGDGKNQCLDYYNGFAFQYYGLLYARWYGEDDPQRCQRFIARARLFASSYCYWFADNGAHLAYGRSLIYRFAPAGFWGLLACFGHPEIDMAQLRGLWSRSMQWWQPQEIFDAAGRITLGYTYPNQLITEYYNSPQSPLWALKAFFPLALPASHPFWSTPSAPLNLAAQKTLVETRQMIQRRHGEAYLISGAKGQHEIRSSADKYMKFAYSSAHGLSVEATRWIASGFIGDNILAFSADKQHWYCRSEWLESQLEGDILTTLWSPLPGCLVTTRQQFNSEGELRSHSIDCSQPLDFIASGHSVDLWLRANRSFDVSAIQPTRGSTTPTGARGSRYFSDIHSTDGCYASGVMPCAPNTNLMFPNAAVPVIGGHLMVGKHQIVTQLRYGPITAYPEE